MPPSPPLAAITWLPSELIIDIFAYLEDPLDLYHASRVGHDWRSLAVESKLWEPHFWRFYRASCQQNDEITGRNDYRRHEAMRTWIRDTLVDKPSKDEPPVKKPEQLHSAQRRESAPPSSFALPFFLRDAEQAISAKVAAPDFHALFVKRMNMDERLLSDLADYILLEDDTVATAMNLAQAYGDDARDLLAALAADQRISERNLAIFAKDKGLESAGKSRSDVSGGETLDKSLRALDVHQRVATGASQPSLELCLSLQHAARHLLSHLQRREAVHTMQKLKLAWSGHARHGLQHELEEMIASSCIGVEEALSSLALFRHGNKNELQQHLDLLALYVWTSLKAHERSLETNRLQPDAQAANRRHGLSLTTRQLVTAVQGVLRDIGFGVALPVDSDDVSNFFLHLSLFCPAQRQAHQITTLAVACAVLRRLGVTATLAGTPNRPLVVVVEDGTRPAEWPDSDANKQWERFFVSPSIANRTVKQAVLESGSAKEWLAAGSTRARSAFEQAQLGSQLDPVSPLDVLQWIADGIGGTLRWVPEPPLGPPRAPAVSGDSSKLPSSLHTMDGLSTLQAYLSGRQSLPPAPLIAAVLPSTLALLPPTRNGAPRVTPTDGKFDAKYAAAWALRAVRPELHLHHPDLSIMCQWLGVAVHTLAGAYSCDIALFIEMHGGDPAQLARSADANDVKLAGREGQGQHNSAESPSLRYVRSFAAKLVSEDHHLNEGLIGSGAGECEIRRGGREVTKPQLLDPSHPRNVRVEHRVGTIFKHRVHGFLGAVIGWDCVRRKNIGWDYETLADPDEPDNQPFYHVVVAHDESHRYVAQSNMEVVRVPPGSTGEEAVAVLLQLLPLLNLRTVGKCFRTVDVSPWALRAEQGSRMRAEGKKDRRERSKEGGQVRLVMSAWMRQAWPYD